MSKEEILAQLKNWLEVHKEIAEEDFKMDPAARYERNLIRELEKLFLSFERPEEFNQQDYMNAAPRFDHYPIRTDECKKRATFEALLDILDEESKIKED